MIELKYKQQCSRSRRNSNKYAEYFYLRSADRSPCNFFGSWELPEGHIFTAYRSRYDKYEHLKSIKFFICQVEKSEKEIIISRSNEFEFHRELNYDEVLGYYVRGKFKVFCAGIGLTYGKRLMEWWNKGDGSIEYAELCAKYLKPRIKEIPTFELEKLKVPQPRLTDAVLGGDDAFYHWLSTAAVLGGCQPKTFDKLYSAD